MKILEKSFVLVCTFCFFVTNGMRGFITNNLRAWKENYFIEKDAPTVFLYHHKHLRPFVRCEASNHFAYMIPFEGSTVNGWNIYDNKRCDDSGNKFTDLTPKKKQDETTLAAFSSSEKKKLKKKKQLILTSFMSRMVVHNDITTKLKHRQQSEEQYEVLERRRQVQLILIDIVDKIHRSFAGNEEITRIVKDSRSLVIAFWIHPFLGNRDYLLSSTTFKINKSTLRTWCTQKKYFCKWLPIVRTLTFSDVLNSLPNPSRSIYVNVLIFRSLSQS